MQVTTPVYVNFIVGIKNIALCNDDDQSNDILDIRYPVYCSCDLKYRCLINRWFARMKN